MQMKAQEETKEGCEGGMIAEMVSRRTENCGKIAIGLMGLNALVVAHNVWRLSLTVTSSQRGDRYQQRLHNRGPLAAQDATIVQSGMHGQIVGKDCQCEASPKRAERAVSVNE